MSRKITSKNAVRDGGVITCRHEEFEIAIEGTSIHGYYDKIFKCKDCGLLDFSLEKGRVEDERQTN